MTAPITANRCDRLVSSTLARRALLLAIVVLAGVVVTNSAASYQIAYVNSALLAAIGAIALNLVMGLSGLVSVGSAALLATGGYSVATLYLDHDIGFLGALAVAGVLGALLGLLIGLPSLRVGGIYLAIATLALHYVVIAAFSAYQSERVGPAGFFLPQADLFGWALTNNRKWLWFLLVCVVLTFAFVSNLKASRFGRAWMYLRDSPLAAASGGLSAMRFNLLAFVLSSAIISVSGALLAYFQGSVYIDSYNLELAIQYIAMIVIGGWGSTAGAVAGAFFVTLLPPLLERVLSVVPPESTFGRYVVQNVGDVQIFIYGALIVGFLIFEPAGLAGLARRAQRRLRSRRSSATAGVA